MDIVIEFFRDTLDGPFYIVWVVVLVILIFACIGYLAEKGINRKKEKEKYATVSDTGNTEVVQNTVVNEPVNDTQVDTSVATPVAETVSEVTTTPVQDVSSTSVVSSQVENNSSVVVTPPLEVQQPVSTVTNVDNSISTDEVDNNVVIPTINQDVNNKS